MKAINPLNGHIIEMERINNRVQVFIGGDTVADTYNAIMVKETGYSPIIYIPKNDLSEIDLIKSSDYHCPFKGHAEIYTIKHGPDNIEQGAWSYDEPNSVWMELKGRVAFFPEKIQELKLL